MSREAGPDLPVWVALRRVRRGGVSRAAGGAWLVGGAPVPAYLAGALDEVLAGELLALSEPGLDTLRRVGLSGAGIARWEQLCHPPGPVSDSETPDGRRSSDPPLPAPGGHPAPPAITDSQLAVLLRQTQWALDAAAHDFPAGRGTPQRREELAATLESLAVIVRASVRDGSS